MSNGTDITRHRYYSYDSNGQLTGRTLPGNMTYSYSIEYGPNRQRVRSVYSKTYQNQYDKFYWDDYEEKVVGIIYGLFNNQL